MSQVKEESRESLPAPVRDERPSLREQIRPPSEAERQEFHEMATKVRASDQTSETEMKKQAQKNVAQYA